MESSAMLPTRLHALIGATACVLALGTLRPAAAQQADEQAPRHGPTPEQKAEMERAVHEAVQQDIRAVAQYKLPKISLPACCP